MVDKNKSETHATDEAQTSESVNPCCSPEKISQMMGKCCGCGAGDVDISAIMEKCCGTKESK